MFMFAVYVWWHGYVYCVTSRLYKLNLPETTANVQINAIDPIARPFVDTYRSGKHIAYQRSSDIKVNVSTDTVTDTVYKRKLNLVAKLKLFLISYYVRTYIYGYHKYIGTLK